MIYTTYFSNIRNLPSGVIPIAICGKPDWWEGFKYWPLAPKRSFFLEWKKTGDNDYYIEHYYDEVLNKLDPHKVVEHLYEITRGKDVALVCYEAPDKFCHRHLVAEWLSNNGYQIEEYGHGKMIIIH